MSDGGRQSHEQPHDASALAADDYDAMWSRLADFLRYNPGARHRRRLVLRALRRHAPGATDLLDVGCGLGEMTAFLSTELPGARFTGIDFSGGAIESCRRRFPAHRFAVADVVNDELPAPFDAVICSELLEHLDEPEAALVRIARSLKPGGTIVVTVPNGKVFDTERAVGHVAHPTVAALGAWFDTAGLHVVEARRWGWPGYLALEVRGQRRCRSCARCAGIGPLFVADPAGERPRVRAHRHRIVARLRQGPADRHRRAARSFVSAIERARGTAPTCRRECSTAG